MTLRTDASSVYIGIDIGGTGMKGAVVRPDGTLLAERSARTPVEQGRDGILRQLEQLASALAADAAPAEASAIGIATAGRVDPAEGVVAYATENLPGWTGTRLAEHMRRKFGVPVYVDNDVNGAALGEAWIGAARAHRTFAFVAMGTGVGGALVHDGRLIHGLTGGAGEVGHMIFVPDGRECNCGQRGCWEQYVSGTALNRAAKAADPAWDSRDLLNRYASGDAKAVRTVREFVSHLAVGLISLRNMFDPELVVLGGGVSEAKDVWWDLLLNELRERSPKRVPVVPASLGNRAGIVGAARLAMERSRS